MRKSSFFTRSSFFIFIIILILFLLSKKSIITNICGALGVFFIAENVKFAVGGFTRAVIDKEFLDEKDYKPVYFQLIRIALVFIFFGLAAFFDK